MESISTRRLGELNSYQVAALAILASGLSTLAVLFLLRRTGVRSESGERTEPGIGEGTQPAVGIEMPAELPDHFTENLIIPGLTETGQQISEQDDRNGRSAEGV